MSWQSFDLDHHAQWIVIEAISRSRDSLAQAYKMRNTCSYGLERFWGEQIRLGRDSNTKHEADFWKDVWDTLVDQMSLAYIYLEPSREQTQRIPSNEEIIRHLWSLNHEEHQIALIVLTNLCDAVVWWKQRLDPGRSV